MKTEKFRIIYLAIALFFLTLPILYLYCGAWIILYKNIMEIDTIEFIFGFTTVISTVVAAASAVFSYRAAKEANQIAHYNVFKEEIISSKFKKHMIDSYSSVIKDEIGEYEPGYEISYYIKEDQFKQLDHLYKMIIEYDKNLSPETNMKIISTMNKMHGTTNSQKLTSQILNDPEYLRSQIECHQENKRKKALEKLEQLSQYLDAIRNSAEI